MVALIQAAGTIMPGESGDEPLQGAVLGSDTLVEQLRDAREDDEVQAVILRVDSPGGSVEASDLIWQEVERVRETKPVIVSMGTYAASGGYYISCGADSIFADAGTLTGSIGVFAGKLDWSGLYDKVGVNREFITRGENALMFSDATDFSPAAARRCSRPNSTASTSGSSPRSAPAAASTATRCTRSPRGGSGPASRRWRSGSSTASADSTGRSSPPRALIGLAPDDVVALRTYEEELSWLQRMVLQSLDEAAVTLPRAGRDPDRHRRRDPAAGARGIPGGDAVARRPTAGAGAVPGRLRVTWPAGGPGWTPRRIPPPAASCDLPRKRGPGPKTVGE